MKTVRRIPRPSGPRTVISNAPRMGRGTPAQRSTVPAWPISLETRALPPAAGRTSACQLITEPGASGSHSCGGSA